MVVVWNSILIKISSGMLAGGGPGVASRITRELRVSGREVGKVRRLLKEGFIAFDEGEKPYFARPVTPPL